MVFDRMKLSDEALELIAERFRSLGEPTRLKILRLLENGEMSVGQLVQELRSSQANISKHLRVLTGTGLLSRRVQGTSAYYSISDPMILKICDTVCNSLAENLKSQVEAFGYQFTPRRGNLRRSGKAGSKPPETVRR